MFSNLFSNLRDQFYGLFGDVWSSTLIQRLFSRYRGLSERDQSALKILAVFFAGLLVFYLLINPVRQYALEEKREYLNNKSTFQWIQSNSKQFESGSRESKSKRGDQSLLSLASNTAKAYGMSFKRYEPVDNGALRLWLEDVLFDDAVLWIEVMDKTYNIVLKEIAVDKASTKGLVTIKLVLQE